MNSDSIGRISVDGTKIDYLVMHVLCSLETSGIPYLDESLLF